MSDLGKNGRIREKEKKEMLILCMHNASLKERNMTAWKHFWAVTRSFDLILNTIPNSSPMLVKRNRSAIVIVIPIEKLTFSREDMSSLSLCNYQIVFLFTANDMHSFSIQKTYFICKKSFLMPSISKMLKTKDKRK